MKRTIYAALAATVALPMLATSAAAQQDRGYGYGQAGERPYQWSEQRGAITRDDGRMDAYAGRGQAPTPPRTPGRYVTDWEQTGQGRDYPNPPWTPERYSTDWDRYGYGERAMADDRWADRDPPTRNFDRPDPPPGYHGDRGGYAHGWRDDRGYGAHAGRGWGGDGRHAGYGRDDMGAHHGHGWHGGSYDRSMPGWMHEQMRARHHGGYEDRDFRRDFSQDGRRGYYQDPSYEQMPHGDRRMARRGDDRRARVEMREMREAMRMIDRFDVDGDGRVTQEEVDRYRSDRLSQFDTDDDRQLTIEEYAALWADAMRERMVRRFQSHDRDGDGLVTVDEFSERTRDMVRARDRNSDDALSGDDFMRPWVEAPMGGSPNRAAESEPMRDNDRSAYGPRPEVEAPMGGAPNEPAGEETYDEIEEVTDDQEDTTSN